MILFRNLVADLTTVSNFSIRRAYSNLTNIIRRQFIGFCDSSLNAYCVAVYLRTINEAGDADCYFVCSKTHVAPLKPYGIHRLELLGAQLLTVLLNPVNIELNIAEEDIFTFSDSQVILYWITRPAKECRSFVLNRTEEILKIMSNKKWAYVNIKNNPADLPSRSVSIEKLTSYNFWLRDPEFLRGNFVFKPFNNVYIEVEASALELRQSTSSCSATTSCRAETDYFSYTHHFSVSCVS